MGKKRGRAPDHAIRWLLVAGFASLLVAGVLSDPRAAAAATTPNVVVIYTDDQRASTVSEMPTVMSELAGKGVTFTNGFVTNPLCCPSRASLLTGTYSHTNGIYTNEPPNGGFEMFDDSSTLATWLDDAGYGTGLFGKYLNGYEDSDMTYVPPGWDRWYAGQGYYGATVSDQGVPTVLASDVYLNDRLRQESTAFIENTPAAEPLFAYVTPFAPHQPAVAETAYEGSYEGIPPWRPPAYNERDVSDKPLWVQALPRRGPADRTRLDRFRINQLETLRSVDDLVADVLAALESSGRLQNTLIVYASDNAFLWGEHRLRGKAVPYDAAIRSPFIVRADFLTPGGIVLPQLALNIDIAPTAADVADLTPPSPVDGRSLVGLLSGSQPKWRTKFLIEHGPSGNAPPFCQLRTRSRTLIHYSTGEEEFYNYRRDPDELANEIAKPSAQDTIARMRADLRTLCDPLPPGMGPF